MKIAIIGATGNVGRELTKEALTRGHDVLAISRSGAAPDAASKGMSVDIGDLNGLTRALSGREIAIFSAPSSHSDPKNVIAAAKQAGVRRILVVGGAGSLEVAPGRMLLEQPSFPADYQTEARAHKAMLDALRQERALDWTIATPSAALAPGARTGKFRFGADQLLTNEKGESAISIADYALAVLDEAESGAHANRRFTVGY